MKNLISYLICLTLLVVNAGMDAVPPQAAITNGVITAKLYLPDATNGYYRGSRFDWAGVVYDLTYKDHHYFGKWFDRYEPTIHDAIMGPVDAFDPIGYDSAAAGETFMKIGIGLLEKPVEPKYAFTTPYKITDNGKWIVKPKKNTIAFTHELNTDKYSYEYTKVLSLTKNKPELVIDHRLKNNGKHTLQSNVFNHNFFVMDQQPTGPDFLVKFPFVPVGEPKGKATAARVEGKNIIYNEVLKKGEFFAISPMTGYGSEATDYDFLVENTKMKTGVHISGDQPIVKFVYWSAPATLCPEAYTRVTVKPGEEIHWTIKYQFSAE